jgi:hypothetical protein
VSAMPPRFSLAAAPRPPARHRTGALHHIRRSVLLLLGINSHALHSGVARYAREADWVLDDTYMRVGLAPTWWWGDGILALITNPKDAQALRRLPDLPLVDLSKGWISDSMPWRYRAAGNRDQGSSGISAFMVARTRMASQPHGSTHRV